MLPVPTSAPDRVRRARRLAFHEPPVHSLGPLASLAQAARGTPDEGETAWLLGATLGGLGRYAEAVAVLEAVDGPGVPAALADGALASLLRQVGRHAEAERHDERAVDRGAALPEDPLAREATLDAAVGLVADAVGQGRVEKAQDRLAAAEALAVTTADGDAGDDGPGLWRPGVRFGWVATEVALLGGDAGRALTQAAAAVATSRAVGAPRHLAKSLLFLGVATAQAGDTATALDQLGEVLDLCAAAGTLPLVWPAHAVLAALHVVAPGAAGPASSAPPAAEVHRRAAGDAVRSLAPLMPSAWRESWLAGPDVAWLTR